MASPDAAILLLSGVDFEPSDQAHYRDRLYQSFCIISWSSGNYRVSVDRQVVDGRKRLRARHFTVHKEKTIEQSLILLEERVNEKHKIIYRMKKDNSKITLSRQDLFKEMYMINGTGSCGQAQLTLEGPNVQVNIQMKKPLEELLREITEPSLREGAKVKHNYFSPPTKATYIGQVRKGDFEYYYMEPRSSRQHQPDGNHINLAFQGGGAKGVSYVGVFQAIEEFQRRIKSPLPIKSVIGSSAGGILSLGISAETPSDQLRDLCLMMDTLTEDLLIETKQEARQAENDPSKSHRKGQRIIDASKESMNQHEQEGHVSFNEKNKSHIEPHFFESQKKYLIQLLNAYGVVEEKMTRNITETLENPEVQQRAVRLLQEVNPTIASLLTFKDDPLEEGEEAGCCCGMCSCCRKRTRDCRSLNLYGLAFGALMTGEGVENILAYCLSMFFRRWVNKNRNDQDKLSLFGEIIRSKETQLKIKIKDSELVHEISRMAKQVEEGYKQYYDFAHPQNGVKRRVLKADMKYTTLDLMRLAKTLTMKQYYAMTEVQFTCTSVDLHDRIERFFNHKTTPLLPVCKAVQMTGSFPVAFKSLQWEPAWGPYYIHYQFTRRQIELTGHHFTDGGLLANFPLEFLDNQKFRPMYFSHQKVQGKTLWYGFGLDQLSPFSEDMEPKPHIEALKNDLLDEVKSSMIRKTLWSYFCCCCCETKRESGEEIKLVVLQFLINLVLALRDSNRNLNRECYRSQLFEMQVPNSSRITSQDNLQRIALEQKVCIKIREARQRNGLKQMIAEVEGSRSHQNLRVKRTTSYRLIKLRVQVEQHYPAQSGQSYSPQSMKSFLDKQMKSLRAILRNLPLITNEQMEAVQVTLQHNFQGILSPAIHAYQQFQLKEQESFTSFFSSAQLEARPLLKLIDDVELQVREFFGKHSPEAKSIIESSKKSTEDYLDLLIQIFHQKCNLILKDPKNRHIEEIVKIGLERVVEMLRAKYRSTPYITEIYQSIRQDKVWPVPLVNIDFYVAQAFATQVAHIRSKITRSLKGKLHRYMRFQQQQPDFKLNPKLHIILEPLWTAHYYFPSYFQILQGVITEINKDFKTKLVKDWVNFNIDAITCSDFHAIFGVMYAMGIPLRRISSEMASLQGLFQSNQDIQQMYQSQKWMGTTTQRVKRALEQAWENRFDIFGHYQQVYQSGDPNHQLDKFDPLVETRVRFSANEMNEAFEKVLDYVASSFNQIKEMKEPERREKFAELMGYISPKEDGSKYGKYFLRELIYYLQDLMMTVGSAIVTSQGYLTLDSSKYDPQIIFKGLLVSKMASAIDYKVYIFALLRQFKIDPEISLKSFYDSSSTKILLNFSCVNTTTECFTFINKNTKPNMPLWAALMSAASLPYLEGEFSSRTEWEGCEASQSINKRQVLEHFRNVEAEGHHRYNAYISGNVLSTLPIDLLTNHNLVQTQIADAGCHPDDYIELAFSFDMEPQLSNQNVAQNRENPVNNKEAYSLSRDESALREPLNRQYNRVEHEQVQSEAKRLINNIARKMQGNTKFPGGCDIIGYLCRFCCCWCCQAPGIGNYFGDLFSNMEVLKVLMLRINAHDNLIFKLYENQLIKLPIRVGTLDFHLINPDTPVLADTLRQDKEVVKELLDNYHEEDGQIQLKKSRSDTETVIEIYSVLLADQERPERQSRKLRLKFISLSKWRRLSRKYTVQVIYPLIPMAKPSAQEKSEVDTLKKQLCSLKQDHIDLDIGPNSPENMRVGLRFTYLSQNSTEVCESFKELVFSRQALDMLAEAVVPQTRFILRLPYKYVLRRQLIEAQAVDFKLEGSHKKGPKLSLPISVQSRGLSLTSPNCLNPECPSPLNALTSILPEANVHQKRKCFLLQIEEVIAMKCDKCPAEYSIKTKLSNYIVKERKLEEEASSLIYRTPGVEGPRGNMKMSYVPIEGRPSASRNFCLVCCRYAYKLRHQLVGPGEKEYNGIYICEACCLLVDNEPPR